MPKLLVKKQRGVALEVNRLAILQNKLVYVLLANRRIKYPWGRSHVAYIGTTKKGAGRILASAAEKARDLLTRHGFKSLKAHIVTCQARPKVETWKKLEKAMILEFRRLYGKLPVGNTQGSRARETDEFRYFNRDRIRTIVEGLE